MARATGKRLDSEDSAAKRRKNAEAQAGFRQRRSTYIDHLEATVQELQDICLQLNSLFVASHQESIELNAKWSHAQARFGSIQQSLDASMPLSTTSSASSNSSARSHPPNVFSPKSSIQGFSPDSSPPGYHLLHEQDFQSIFLRAPAEPCPKVTSTQSPQFSQSNSTSTIDAQSHQSWLSELSSHGGTPMPHQQHDQVAHDGGNGPPSDLSLHEPAYDWAAATSHPRNEQQAAQLHSSPAHMSLFQNAAVTVSTPLASLTPGAASAIPPTATFTPDRLSSLNSDSRTHTSGHSGGPLTRSQRFHAYSTELYDSHNPCSTGSNVARADSLGVRWSRCDEALQSGRRALHEAQSLKIQRTQSEKQGFMGNVVVERN